MAEQTQVEIKDKFCLTIDEASAYFNIGEKKLRKNHKEFLDVRDKYDEVKDRREQAERIFEDSRAGILAEKLVEGKECPACGSLHPPKPALL